MSEKRMGRINEEMQRELSRLIPTVKDPRVTGLISVTGAEVSPDMKYAKVFISVLEKENTKAVLKGLKSAAGYLRREVGASLRLRNTPELTFVEDTSIGQGARIQEVLRGLKEKEGDHDGL